MRDSGAPHYISLYLVCLVSFIGSWSFFTPAFRSFTKSEVVLSKNGTEPLVRLLEWGLFIRRKGVWSDLDYLVRIESSDGSGKFVRRKFSTQRVVFKLKESLGLLANKRSFSNKFSDSTWKAIFHSKEKSTDTERYINPEIGETEVL